VGFYIWKGFNFGPLRLNLSRSGLGASFGVTGARVGVAPRGSYIQLGRGGLYYRQSLGSPEPVRRLTRPPATDLESLPPATASASYLSPFPNRLQHECRLLMCYATDSLLPILREFRPRGGPLRRCRVFCSAFQCCSGPALAMSPAVRLFCGMT
jgi:Protein of unknown function (DUF4236)